MLVNDEGRVAPMHWLCIRCMRYHHSPEEVERCAREWKPKPLTEEQIRASLDWVATHDMKLEK